jgi:hypothetical protein
MLKRFTRSAAENCCLRHVETHLDDWLSINPADLAGGGQTRGATRDEV